MSNEAEQTAQRKAKLAELVKLGVPAYPNRFDRSETVSAIVSAHGGKAGADLEAEKIQVRAAGRHR